MIKTKTVKDSLVVEFENTHNTIVNSIRRVILDEVPTFAISDVEVIKNDSTIYEETIAQRLGLVPITTDFKSYNFKNGCSCGGVGCSLCEVKMTLSKEGLGYVYSGDITSDDPRIVPSDLKIPITKLFKEDQKVELNFKAELGVGRDHAKWAPAHTYLRENESNNVELVVESFGQMSNKEIYNKAISIIIEKLVDLESKL